MFHFPHYIFFCPFHTTTFITKSARLAQVLLDFQAYQSNSFTLEVWRGAQTSRGRSEEVEPMKGQNPPGCLSLEVFWPCSTGRRPWGELNTGWIGLYVSSDLSETPQDSPGGAGGLLGIGMSAFTIIIRSYTYLMKQCEHIQRRLAAALKIRHQCYSGNKMVVNYSLVRPGM